MVHTQAGRARASRGPVVHDRIRQETRAEHERVDAAYAGYDLSTRPGYIKFLQAHRKALWRLEPSWRPVDRAEFTDLAANLDADLDELSARPARPETVACLDGLAVAYVMRGSRLGGAILRRRIGRGLPGRYMHLPMTLSWPEFTRQLDQVSLDDAIIADARAAFAAFLPTDDR